MCLCGEYLLAHTEFVPVHPRVQWCCDHCDVWKELRWNCCVRAVISFTALSNKLHQPHLACIVATCFGFASHQRHTAWYPGSDGCNRFQEGVQAERPPVFGSSRLGNRRPDSVRPRLCWSSVHSGTPTRMVLRLTRGFCRSAHPDRSSFGSE